MTAQHRPDTHRPRRPHPSDSQPRSRNGQFHYRSTRIAALAEAKPGSDEHRQALRNHTEWMLAARRAVNTSADFFAHHPDALHEAADLGAEAYIARARMAGLLWHRPLREQLYRWREHEKRTGTDE